jgi:hypothetical protein
MAPTLNKIVVKQKATLLVYSLAVAHFFIALGRDDAFGELFWQKAYYQDLFFVSLIVFTVSLFILFVWKKLDPFLSWQDHFEKRLLTQFLGGILMPTLFSAVLVYGYMEFILQQNILSTSYFYYELPISGLVILVINLLLGIHHLIYNKKEISGPAPTVRKYPLTLQSGNTQILLDPDQILLAEKEDAVCLVYTTSKNRYIFPHSLDLLSQQLQPSDFFRTNRQTITHRNNCHAFETERSGKLVLTLHYPSGKSITISQKKAKEFKTWLKGHQ